ncbi:MAG: hypothetical protein ACLFVC_07370 [Opitutales bacterium]
MTDPSEHPSPAETQQPGLRYARWAGCALGAVLLISAVATLTTGNIETFPLIRSLYSLLYGAVLVLPFSRFEDPTWKWTYGLLVALSAGFVFLMIASVMFDYMAAAERGERLGVPGFEGLLLFIALLQVPVLLFQRKPDLLD